MSPDGPKPPRVFLSYAWEDDAYRSQVKSLATRLRHDGIDVRLDAWHADIDIPGFMERETRHADFVVVLCSPAYRAKVNAMQDGERITGVGWEHLLFTSALWNAEKDRRTLIATHFRGEWREAAPMFLSAFARFDLRPDQTKFEEEYRELLRRLTGKTEKAPALGTLPSDLDPQPVAPLRGLDAGPPPVAAIAKLPVTDATLIGRDKELATLEEAWARDANLLQIIAPGGTGKTALMTKWYKRRVGEVPIYGWSFYRQGTGDNANVSSDEFLDAVVGHFNLAPKANTADAKVAALVHHLHQHKTLLILDGLEPLQNQTNGDLTDFPLKDLLRELTVQNAGLVLCTTRVRLADVAEDEPLAPEIVLDNLTPADGARLLREKFGVHGSDDDLVEASQAYGNHALALTLLGTYLKRRDGDVSRRFEIDELPGPRDQAG